MEPEDIFDGLGVEVRLKTKDDFLKVKETLTRMGVSSKKEKSCIKVATSSTSVDDTLLCTLKKC
jgi:hypothetical protein